MFIKLFLRLFVILYCCSHTSLAESFDSSLPTDNWEFYRSNETYGRIQAINGRMRMDVSASGNLSLNEAIHTVNLDNVSSATLSFQQLDTADEDTNLPDSFIGHSNGDGVAISADGTQWYTIVNATSLNTATLNTFNIDLIAERDRIRSNYDPNFALTSDFKIKFQQYDNFPNPSDGREWDNIVVNSITQNPTLTLTGPVEILEGTTNTLTLSVTPTPPSDLVVELDSQLSLINLPDSITIPAGLSSQDFDVSVTDNTRRQSSSTSIITASSQGFISAETSLKVYDDESPYTVTFDLDGKGSLLSGQLTQNVIWGEAAIEPVITANEGWKFDGWDHDFSSIKSSLTIQAQYTASVLITFDVGDKGVLSSGQNVQEIELGKTATPPKVTGQEGWTFTGWGGSYTNLTENRTLTALYTPNELVGTLEKKITLDGGNFDDNFGKSVSICGDTAAVGSFDNSGSFSYAGAVYIFVRNNGSWSQQAKLTPTDGSSYDYFGHSLSLDGDIVVIGAYGNDTNGSESGCAYIFERDGETWSQLAKLTASDGDTNDNFGRSVSVSGDTAVIGAYGDDDNGAQSGSAYVFVRNGATWSEQQKLTSSNAATDDHFGYSVAISNDKLAVGAHKSDTNGNDSGSAYIFQRFGNTWTEQTQLTPGGSSAGSLFGHSVSISDDTILVGAHADDDDGYNSGSAYIYEFDGLYWTQQIKLTASDGAANRSFAWAVSLENDFAVIGAVDRAYIYERINGSWVEREKVTDPDSTGSNDFAESVSLHGDTVIVGTPHDNNTIGSVYIYDLATPPATVNFDLGSHGSRTGGGALSQHVKVNTAAQAPAFTVTSGWFFDGWSTDFSAVTSDLLVTAQYVPLHQVTFDLGSYGTHVGGGSLNQMVGQGHAAQAPEVSATSGWALVGWDTDFGSIAGNITVAAQYLPTYSVTFDLGTHGNLLDGNLNQEVIQGGSAIAPIVQTQANWSFVGWSRSLSNISQVTTITAQYAPNNLVGILKSLETASDGARDDHFGHSVSISGDTALIGAHDDDDNGNSSGSVYVFVRENNVWVEQAKLTASDGTTDLLFGSSVSIFGDTALIGAYGDSHSGPQSGSAYVFIRNGTTWTEQAKLTASDGAENDRFGYSVSISQDTAVVGSYLDDDSEPSSGSAYIYERNGVSWSEKVKLTASDSSSSNYFGHSVSIYNDTAIIGAYGSATNGTNSGCAYIFTKNANSWSELQKLTSSDGARDDNFGYSVSLSHNTAVVGARGDQDFGTASGSAYVFVESNGTWSEQSKLTASNGSIADYYGMNVSVSGDVAIIGASRNNSAYVYTRTAETWTEKHILTSNYQFGHSVSINGDTALIGEPNGSSNGNAYFYDLGTAPYSISFDLGDHGIRTGGGELNQQVKIHSAATAPEVTANAGWIFTGWDQSFDSVTADLIIAATYIPSYQVEFDLGHQASHSGGGALIQTVGYQRAADVPHVTVSAGWALKGWDTKFNSITSDVVISAVYAPTHTVNFDLGSHGTLLHGSLTQDVAHGSSATAPSITPSNGWSFVGWDTNLNNITDATTIVAQYVSSDLAGILENEHFPSDIQDNDTFGSSVSACGDTVIVGAPHDDDHGSSSGSAYVFVRQNGAWIEQAKLTASDAKANQYFGSKVSLCGDTVVIGVYKDATNGTDSGCAYIFERQSETWTEQAKIIASDGSENDYFGYSVGASREAVIIGARYDYSQGSAYIFEKTNGIWAQQAKLTASDAANYDNFGEAVSIDNDTAIVGSYADDDNGHGSGSAYIFVKQNGGWIEQAKLTANDPTSTASNAFGDTVDLDGNTAIIGAYGDDDNGSLSGSAYIFTRENQTWTQQAKLLANDGAPSDLFSWSVSVSGNTAVIGAYHDDDHGSNSGSAYIFTRNGQTWTESMKLTASNAGAGEGFGGSVSISSDTAFIGATGTKSARGSLYTYDLGSPPVTVTFDTGLHGSRTGGGELNQLITVNQSAEAPELSVDSGWQFQGWDTEFSAVTTNLTVTAQYLPVYVVTFDLGIRGTLMNGSLSQEIAQGYSAITPEITVENGWSFVGWSHSYNDVTSDLTVVAEYAPSELVSIIENKLISTDIDSGDYFGYSVSICGDTAVIGAYQDDDLGFSSGSAFIFVKEQGVWTQQAKLTASDGAANDEFGYSVAISGDTAVIGSRGDDDKGSSSGSVYVFVSQSGVWIEQAKLVANDGEANDKFGSALSIYANTIAVGSHLDDDNGTSSGSVYVYKRSLGSWTEQAKLKASDGATYDNFGFSLDLTVNSLVIGSKHDDNKGSAYIFERTNEIWTEQAKLTASDQSDHDYFGHAVHMNGDSVIIGAYGDDDNGSDSGSAYVFTRKNGLWIEQAKLVPTNGLFNNYFGYSVAISDKTAVIGAYQTHSSRPNTGSAYIFTRSGDTWSQKDQLAPTDGILPHAFAQSLSMSSDTVIFGTGAHDGSIYIYDLAIPPASVNFELGTIGSRAGGGELNQLIKLQSAATAPVVTPSLGWLLDRWDTDFNTITQDTTVRAIYRYDSTNLDSDDIWDGWELAHFGNTSSTNGTIDTDKDGVSDYDEFLAGSNPNDQSDYLRLLENLTLSNDTQQVTMNFSTNDDIAERRYRILYSEDLQPDSWIELPLGTFNPDAGEFTEKTFNKPGNASKYFFKVEALLQE